MNPDDLRKQLNPDYLNSLIVSEEYLVLPIGPMTACTITLRNGSRVVGETGISGEKGRPVARGDALRKLYDLEKYLAYQRKYEVQRMLDHESDEG